jgi:hypothetical protein
LQYRQSNNPLDYYIAQQVGMALRVFEQPEAQRFDFSSDGTGEQHLEAVIKATSKQRRFCVYGDGSVVTA